MENEDLNAGLSTKTDDEIIKDGKPDDHVYEQQISGVSSTSAEKDTNGGGEFEPGIEQPVSVGNTDKPSKDTNEPADGAQADTITTVEEGKVGIDEGENSEATPTSPEEDITEINFQVERDDGHESPESIRRHQLEDLNPANTAKVFVHMHDVPEYKKVQPESFLWLSMFVLIFFSRIFGAIALYKSVKVRLLFLEQKYEESEQSSRDAKKWNLIGMIFCLFWVVIVVVLIKGLGLLDHSEDMLVGASSSI